MTQLPPDYPPPGSPQPPGPPGTGPQAPWGWGPPPGTPVGWAPSYTPAPPRKTNWAPLAVAIVLIVATVGVLVVVLAQDDSSSGSPEAAVRAFVEADSCPALADATTAAWQADYLDRYAPPEGVEPATTFIEACEQVREEGVTPIADAGVFGDAEVVSQEGDTARVRATSTDASGAELDIEYTVVRENGTWKVDQLASPDGESVESGDVDSLPTLPEETDVPSDEEGATEGDIPEGAHLDPSMPSGLAPDPDANGNLPEDVVENLYQAAQEGDCEVGRESVTESLWTEDGAISDQEAMDQCLADGPSTLTLESAEYAGILIEPDPELAAAGMLPNTAVVEVVDSGGARSIWLILEDGLWKVYG